MKKQFILISLCATLLLTTSCSTSTPKVSDSIEESSLETAEAMETSETDELDFDRLSSGAVIGLKDSENKIHKMIIWGTIINGEPSEETIYNVSDYPGRYGEIVDNDNQISRTTIYSCTQEDIIEIYYYGYQENDGFINKYQESNTSLLPLGSIVKIKNSDKTYVVFFRHTAIYANNKCIYDYVLFNISDTMDFENGRVNFPELKYIMKDEIESVIHIGYIDEDEIAYNDEYKKAIFEAYPDQLPLGTTIQLGETLYTIMQHDVPGEKGEQIYDYMAVSQEHSFVNDLLQSDDNQVLLQGDSSGNQDSILINHDEIGRYALVSKGLSIEEETLLTPISSTEADLANLLPGAVLTLTDRPNQKFTLISIEAVAFEGKDNVLLMLVPWPGSASITSQSSTDHVTINDGGAVLVRELTDIDSVIFYGKTNERIQQTQDDILNSLEAYSDKTQQNKI